MNADQPLKSENKVEGKPSDADQDGSKKDHRRILKQRMKNWRGVVVIGITVVLFAAVFLFAPHIPQDESYHGFADARTFFGIPRTWDVVGNVGFLLVGLLGLK